MQSPAKKHATKRPAATSNGVTKRRKNRKALTNISNKSKQSRELCEKSAAIRSSRSRANKHKHLPAQKTDHSYTSKLPCEKDSDTSKRPCEKDRQHVKLVLDFISKEGHSEIPTNNVKSYAALRALRNKQKQGELHKELLAKLNKTKLWFVSGTDARFARNAAIYDSRTSGFKVNFKTRFTNSLLISICA